MSWHDNSLSTWLFHDELCKPAKNTGKATDAALTAMEAELAKPKPDFLRLRVALSKAHGLSTKQVERAQALYLRLWATSATGKGRAEEDLLSVVAHAADPVSIPFWKEVMALRRARDTFAAQRRALCTTALAFAVAKKPDSTAWDMLVEMTADPNAEARTCAVQALIELYEQAEALRERALAVLWKVAREDSLFESRFLARRFLGPLFPEKGNKGGLPGKETAFAFKASFGRAHRTVELTANQTLRHLSNAILHAFQWDSDHLFAFYLTGNQKDQKFAVPDRTESDAIVPDFGFGGEAPCDPEDWTSLEMTLGAIGMGVGHKFLYLFDFGDNNLFSIQVTGIHPSEKRAKYPRTVETVGQAPPQYSGGW